MAAPQVEAWTFNANELASSWYKSICFQFQRNRSEYEEDLSFPEHI